MAVLSRYDQAQTVLVSGAAVGESKRRSGSMCVVCVFFFSSRRRHTRFDCDWSSDVCSSDLKRNPNVVYAEPDYQVQAIDTTPLDPMWSQQWDMTKIQAPAAWDKQTNAGDVVVAVVDTGIASNHPDLQASLWTDPVTLAHGFTCIGGTCTAGGNDDYGHGTHVAGTIGAAVNNGIGIAGINWAVKLMSMKFLDSSGHGSISD